MEIISEGDGTWILNSDTGHTYTVTLNSCSCPHFIHRLSKTGGSCKHMIFVNGLDNKNHNYDEIINFIRIVGYPSHSVLEKEFGKNISDSLNILVKKGKILYNRRKDTYNILE